jgi:ElaB/YqjD/DUF883 family membrane-anchored ribosome-binding protein
MDHEAEVILSEMEKKRTDITEKMEKIEDRLTSTVTGTTEAVEKTATAVTEAVEGTVKAVTEPIKETVQAVKETFNLRRQAENHPWAVLGGAVAVGYVGGCLLGDHGLPFGRHEGTSYEVPASAASSYAAPPPAAPAGPGWMDQLGQTLAPALQKLKGLAVSAATGLIGEMLLKNVPQAYHAQLQEVVDNFTTSLGGQPIHNATGRGSAL